MPAGFQPAFAVSAGFQPARAVPAGLQPATAVPPGFQLASLSGIDDMPAADSAVQPLRIERIKLRRDFLAANAGVRVPTAAFVLLVKPADSGVARAGFTVSKKVGNAVVRNRARRRLREAARLVMPDHAVPGADHVFIARAAETERPFEQLLTDTRQALQKARRKLDAGA